MKQDEFKPCLVCGRGVMHDNNIMFITLTASKKVIDLGAVRRQAGLEMQIGALASVMGPDEDLAKEADTTGEVCLCLDCACKTPVVELFGLQDKAEPEFKVRRFLSDDVLNNAREQLAKADADLG